MAAELTVVCPTCGLKAQYHHAPNGLDTTKFDSTQFNDNCLRKIPSKPYDCADLAKATLTARLTES